MKKIKWKMYENNDFVDYFKFFFQLPIKPLTFDQVSKPNLHTENIYQINLIVKQN